MVTTYELTVLTIFFPDIYGYEKAQRQSCAIAKMTAQCALYTGAVKICGSP